VAEGYVLPVGLGIMQTKYTKTFIWHRQRYRGCQSTS